MYLKQFMSNNPSDRFFSLVATRTSLLLFSLLLVSTLAVMNSTHRVVQSRGPSAEHVHRGQSLPTNAGSFSSSNSPNALTAPSTVAVPSNDRAQLFRGFNQSGEDLAALAQELLSLINQERASRGLAALEVNDLLTQAARLHSEDMASREVESHTGSDGSGPGERIRRAGYQWDAFGENLSKPGADPAKIITGWLGDPAHAINMLSPTLRDFGAGVARSSAGRYYWTANFGLPYTPIPSPPPVTMLVGLDGGVVNVGGGLTKDGGVSLVGGPGAFTVPTNVTVSVTYTAPSGVSVSGGVLLAETIEVTTDTNAALVRAVEIYVNLSSDVLAGIAIEDVRGAVVVGAMAEPRPTRIINAAEGTVSITVDHFTKFTLFAVTNPGPNLTAPNDAQLLLSFSATVSWTPPLGTTQFHLQVVPFNNDGPGVDLIRNADASFTLPAPPEWYGLLPDMTYFWRVRTTTVTTVPTEKDWTAWSGRTFRTPKVSPTKISPIEPADRSTVTSLTPTLTWADSNSEVFYYEVQVSKDDGFVTDRAAASAAVYWALIHGGVTVPLNSYKIPSAFPLEAGITYYWRVRPRVQGDSMPIPWSQKWGFVTGP